MPTRPSVFSPDQLYSTQRLLLLPSHPHLAGRAADFYARNRDFFTDTDPARPMEFFTAPYQRRLLADERRRARARPLPLMLRLWLVESNGRGAAGPAAQGGGMPPLCVGSSVSLRKSNFAKLLSARLGPSVPIIGTVALGSIVGGAFLSAFVSYKLDEAATGRGLAAEAVRALIAIAFGRLGLHRLEANIMPCNTPSLRLAERLGFVNEGLARRYLRINGAWEDHIHMVLLNEAPLVGEGPA